MRRNNTHAKPGDQQPFERNSIGQDLDRLRFPVRSGYSHKLLVIAVCILGWWNVPSSAWAQRFRNAQGEMPSASEIIVAPREVLAFLDEAKQKIASKDWAEATQALGSILGLEQESTEMDQDYFLGMEDEFSSGSLRSAAMQLMETLPEEGAKIAELRFGVTAKNLLETAIAAGDWPAILEVGRRFGFTDAGRRSLWLLAEEAMSQGQLSTAGGFFEKLLTQPSARKEFGPELGLMAAICWKATNQTKRAEVAIERSGGFWPRASWNWGGKNYRLGGNKADRDALLAALSTDRLDVTQPKSSDWFLPGGRADNNAHGFAGPVMPILRWHVEMHPSPQDKGAIAYAVQDKLNDKAALIPTRYPVVAGKNIFVRTYDQRTIGIDELSGKVVWDQAFEGFPIRLLSNSTSMGAGEAEFQVPEKLQSAVWGDASLGQLTSDGKRLYGVCEISANQAAQNLVLGANVAITRATPRSNSNVLRAWSIDRQGAIEWEVGGETGLKAPDLAGALFLGPPTPWENSLLALTEMNGEVFLVSLNSVDGSVQWLQQLVANTVAPIATDTMRRSLGASPAISGNIAVCPTLSGIYVAFNLTDRTLLWARRYSKQLQNFSNVNIFGASVNQNFDPLLVRAVDASLTIANGCVVGMPNDAEGGFFSLDLYTGAELWKIPNREPWRYVGGIFENAVLLVGDRQLFAMDLQEGKTLWDSPTILEDGAKVSGRGTRNQGSYFLPTTNQEMVQIDIRNGKILSRHRVETMLGNLVSTDGAIISTGPTEINYFVLKDRLRSDIDVEFLKDNSSPWAVAKKGELLFAEGDLAGAMEAIIKAHELAPDNTDIQQLLSKVGIAAIRSDFERFAPLLPKFEKVMSIGKEQELYLTIMVDGFLKSNDVLSAFDRLLLLSDRRVRQRMSHNSELETIEPSKGYVVQLDRWIAAQLERIWEQASESDRALLQQRLASRVERARTEALPVRRRSLAHLWRLPPFADLVLESAIDLKRIAEWSTASDYLEHLIANAPQPIAKKASLALADIYGQLGLVSNSFRMSQSTELGSPELIEQNQKLMNEGSKNSRTDITIRPALGFPSVNRTLYGMSPNDLEALDKPIDAWGKGLVKVQAMRLEQLGLSRVTPLTTRTEQGQMLRDWKLMLTQNEVLFQNPWGQELFTAPVELPQRALGEINYNAMIVNHLIFLEMPNEVIAMDALLAASSQSSNIWRNSLGRPVDYDLSGSQRQRSNTLDETTQWGETKRKTTAEYNLLTACDAGVVVRSGDELLCMDPKNGRKLWSRRGVSRNISASRDGYTLAVFDNQLGTCTLFDCRDGRQLQSLPWSEGFEFKSAVGKRVLCDRKDGNRGGIFRLWDWSSQSVILEKAFPSGTLASISEDRYLVIYTPAKGDSESTGSLVFWDMKEGKEFSHPLDLGKKPLKEIRVVPFAESLLILPSGTSYDIKLEIPNHVRDPELRVVAGPMMAISKQDGRVLWSKSVPTYKYYFPIVQSTRSPVITLVRRIKLPPYGDQKGRDVASIAVLDVRTGETLFHDDHLMLVLNSGFHQRVLPSSEMVHVSYGGQAIELQFTQEEKPPAPIGPVGYTTNERMRLEERMNASESVEDSLLDRDLEEGIMELPKNPRDRFRQRPAPPRR